ncbi:hypothetical protein KP509_08G013400 [Ceratopteris richardii]|uniref:Uncharacterized protein n=2 Tax=Ceratopteris richardii TaxID=49495 RepID=A0A8T2UAZ7_CERRI|nr:hypothetical protein KP509_08G013400 [Ceratopteris richardii]
MESDRQASMGRPHFIRESMQNRKKDVRVARDLSRNTAVLHDPTACETQARGRNKEPSDEGNLHTSKGLGWFLLNTCRYMGDVVEPSTLQGHGQPHFQPAAPSMKTRKRAATATSLRSLFPPQYRHHNHLSSHAMPDSACHQFGIDAAYDSSSHCQAHRQKTAMANGPRTSPCNSNGSSREDQIAGIRAAIAYCKESQS